MSPAERRIKAAVHGLIDVGVYPGPTQIKRLLGESGACNNLNGRECRWREEVFAERGWKRYRRFDRARRWIPPDDWQEAT